MTAKRPTVSTVKTLFALSGNTCSYTGLGRHPACEAPLTDPSWKEVNADIAHIRGEMPTAARYDASMSDDERAAFDNLLLLCLGCHRLIDRLEPTEHTVAVLHQMKERHEGAASDRWYDPSLLQKTTEALLSAFARTYGASEPAAVPGPLPAQSAADALDDLGLELRSRRHEAGMSVRDFAHRLGKSESSVSRWERGVTHPSPRSRADITELLRQLPQTRRSPEIEGGHNLARVPSWAQQVLRALANGDRGISELAQAINLPPETMSRTVRALADDGLVERRVDPMDGRRRPYGLTPAGLQYLGSLRDQ